MNVGTETSYDNLSQHLGTVGCQDTINLLDVQYTFSTALTVTRASIRARSLQIMNSVENCDRLRLFFVVATIWIN